MLLVQTYSEKSSVHGIGLFAAQFIPQGAVIWRFVHGHDLIMPHDQLAQLPDEIREDWVRFAYTSRFSGLLVRAGDAYVFMNHSHQPNVGVARRFEPPEGYDVALRDILPGQELLFDYTWFGEDPCCKPEQPRLPELKSFT